MKQIPIEHYSHAIHPIKNPYFDADVSIEAWRSTRLALMLMFNNEFNEDYEEAKAFLKGKEDFNVEKDIGFIDEYPLSIDYIEPNVNDTPPHWQYLISYGGPGSEIRFFVDDKSSTKPYKVEFWFLEWSNSGKQEVTDEAIIEQLWEQALLPLTEPMETQTGLTSSPKGFAYSETQGADPLLALAGMLECDVTEIKKQFKTSVRPKARVVKGSIRRPFGSAHCVVRNVGV